MSYLKLQSIQWKELETSDLSDTDNFQYKNQDNSGAALFVGTGGDLKVKSRRGDEVTFKNIADGSFLPIQAVRVFSTGTTASDIIALW